MNVELYKKVIDEVKDYAFYQMIYFQGEPFLHQDFFEFIEYADQNKIYTSSSTNGHFLNQENCYKLIKSGLRKIIISLDGINQENYEKYRVKGDFSAVVKGIQNLVSAKKEMHSKFPLVYMQFLVFKHNENHIKEIKTLSKQLGVNKFELKSAQIEDFAKNSKLIPDQSKYSRYSKKKRYQIKTKWRNICFRIWSTAVITWDGTLIPCCFDKNLSFKLGNVNIQNLKALWKSNEFNDFRNEILHNRKKNSICRNCSAGLRIKY
jgi:radical SAM protein with 4Fe4S-binding SPASM domain